MRGFWSYHSSVKVVRNNNNSSSKSNYKIKISYVLLFSLPINTKRGSANSMQMLFVLYLSWSEIQLNLKSSPPTFMEYFMAQSWLCGNIQSRGFRSPTFLSTPPFIFCFRKKMFFRRNYFQKFQILEKKTSFDKRKTHQFG